MNLNISEHSVFLDPDNNFVIKDMTGGIAWYQGYFGTGVSNIIQGFKKPPQDVSGKYYGYSIVANKKTFQTKGELENTVSYNIINNKVYITNKYTILKGTYNGGDY